jgi:hypothetical protein
MIRGRVCNVVKGFARHRDHMRLKKFELFGCLETERKTPQRPTENSLPNLAPLGANRNFRANGSYSVFAGVFKCDVNVSVCLDF